LKVEAFTDVDWARSSGDRRSIFGYCSFIGSNLVLWRNKKQLVVARLCVEAKYWAMAHGVWTFVAKNLMHEMGITVSGPLSLFCDNIKAIKIAHNPV
jgi:hypothetical protein